MNFFDLKIHGAIFERRGYGRGYYDSVLSAGMDAVGIIFRGQLVDRIDADPWDVKLSRVITG